MPGITRQLELHRMSMICSIRFLVKKKIRIYINQPNCQNCQCWTKLKEKLKFPVFLNAQIASRWSLQLKLLASCLYVTLYASESEKHSISSESSAMQLWQRFHFWQILSRRSTAVPWRLMLESFGLFVVFDVILFIEIWIHTRQRFYFKKSITDER